MHKSRLIVISTFLVICIVGFLVVTANAKPQLNYFPETDERPSWLQPDNSPAQMVKDFLWASAYLPPPETQIRCCTATLEWAIDDTSEIIHPRRKITDLSIKRIHLSSPYTLLSNLLDDDPVYGAAVHVTVKTADGKTSRLIVELWDYGLLVPWSFYRYGDGWKPGKILYVN